MADALTQYKLIVLYMLDRVDFPLSNTQITNFMQGKDYTSYFTVQQTLSELLEAGLIRMESDRSRTRYYITEEGRQTLSYFPDKISPAIKSDIRTYFEENKMQLRKEISVIADYDKTTAQDYAVRCQLKERERTFLDLTLTVRSAEQAEAVCANWKARQEDVYACLMDLLLQ